jgi:hypothetical protein
MRGKLQPMSLKLKEIIKNKNVMILVDSGSTDHCINLTLVKQLKLFLYLTKDLTVIIADGQKIKEIGRCHIISIQIQKLELQSRFYTLPLDEIDMVLRVEWLIELGSYTTNLEEQFMELNWQG